MYKNQSLRAKKNEFREKYRSKRENMTVENKSELDSKISDALIDTMVYKHSSQILFYASTYDEIDTKTILKQAISDGKMVLFPKCEDEYSMNYYYIKSENDLSPGKFGILEPSPSEIYVPKASDICIVPAMTYDKAGYRLGYGRGFYDRFLADFLGVKVGLCYNDFVENQIPKGRYDIKIDVLITENGVYPLQKQK